MGRTLRKAGSGWGNRRRNKSDNKSRATTEQHNSSNSSTATAHRETAAALYYLFFLRSIMVEMLSISWGPRSPQKFRKSHWCVPFTATFSKRRKIGALWSERCDAQMLKKGVSPWRTPDPIVDKAISSICVEKWFLTKVLVLTASFFHEGDCWK